MLVKIAQTSLNTKLHPKMANQLTDICVDAMLSIDQGWVHQSSLFGLTGFYQN